MSKILVPRSFSSPIEPTHISRLKAVGRWRLPQEGSQEWVDLRLRAAAAERDPRYRKQLKDIGRVGISTMLAVERNGAGLPADSGVREFIGEYNRRTTQHGLHYLPSSFNIFEAFTSYLPKYAVFVPLEERDHICSVRGFLDYQAGLEEDFAVHGTDMPEGRVLNFSFSEPAGDWVFEHESERFVLSSVSIVRHESEVTLMCLGGVERDLVSETSRVSSISLDDSRDPAKPNLEIDGSLKAEAVALDDGGRFHRLFFGLRYDLRRRAMQARYMFFDDGNSWEVKTDDLLTLGYAAEFGREGSPEHWAAYFENRGGLFAFLVRFMGLPSYFESRKASVVSDRAITSLAEDKDSVKGRRRFEKALRPQIVYERSVKTLFDTGSEPDSVVLPPLELNVEVEGFWEKLPFGTYGSGPEGERVLGRTWVRKTLSSRRAQMAGAFVAGSTSQERSILLENEEGYIYVLRNAAHQIDIFKIGLTRRSVSTRATELSRGTGIPDLFLTVQSWWVPDVVYAEKRIHQILDEYRLRDAREFFRAPYPTIRSAIDMVVNELSGRSVPAGSALT